MIETFTPHLIDHILFVVLGVVLPLRTVGGQRKLKDIRFDERMRRMLYIANSAGLWLLALIVLAAWWWLDRPFSSLGLQWTPAALSVWSIGIVLFFFLLYLGDTAYDLLTSKGRSEAEERLGAELSILPRQLKTYLYFIPLAFSAGICEEIVFRGFFVTYLVNLFGHTLTGQILAVGIPALIFGVVHTYQGKQAMVKIVGMAAIFGALYLFTGSIYLLIILHTAVDLVGGSVGLFFPERELPLEDDAWTWEEEE